MPRSTTHNVYGKRVLQLGCEKGLDVWNLQVKLIGWGSGSDNDGIGNVMDPVRLTGEFDSTTRDAVMRFQKAHKLPLNGIADPALFWALDREAALHPVVVHDMRCPCAIGKNDGPIHCRCTGLDTSTPPKPKQHPSEGKCDGSGNDGFGKKRFSGEFLLKDKKLVDNTDLSSEKLDLYDMYEYPGMDKAVLWAVRALMHRSELQSDTQFKAIKVVSGYRCWHDNYHHTDDARWRHRRSTFNFGKTIEFYIQDHCTETEWKEDTSDTQDPRRPKVCPQCQAVQKVAIEKCGFQHRWHEPGRVCMAEVSKDARPPASPVAVHVNTVRLHERNSNHALDYTDHFVKTDADAIGPLYEGLIPNASFPLVLAEGVDTGSAADVKMALDPKLASSTDFFKNIESAPGGWFPMGRSRIWHGGVHLYAAAGTEVRAIADGEIVGCRAGDGEEQPHGSRNFVLVKHTIKAEGAWKDKVFYCLYMHLDEEKATTAAKVAWRRELFIRSKNHVEASKPAPIFELKTVDTKKRFIANKVGLAAGQAHEVSDDPANATTLDDQGPADSMAVKLKVTGPGDFYFFTKREKIEFGTKRDAVAGLADKLTQGKIVGLGFPIQVQAGEVLGKIGKAATADPVKKLGAFLHLETFAAAALPMGDGFVSIDVTDAMKLANRKECVKALVDKKLIPEFPDGVVLESELKRLYEKPPYYTRLRSVILNMQNLWAVDWKKTLKDGGCYGFLQDDTLEKAGTAFNEYAWWTDVNTQKGDLPADKSVFHYHPISLIVQIAFGQ